MDAKVYYQAVIIDSRTGNYKTATWDGSPAPKFRTLWQATDDLPHLAKLLDPQPHLHLGVQEVRSRLMPGSKPLADYTREG